MEHPIVRQDVMTLLVRACPSYRNRRMTYLDENYTEGDEQLLYLDLADFARHLISLFKANEIQEFPEIFSRRFAYYWR
ncbi:hypothetical protein SAMN04487970_10517 [Paenibacillus tianmuensis]|uniref:DUF7674 domain-containing protein n=2 Tax=Paenibacillus tianmuensis TaxID=624147 RepID=A0A1G4TFR5_9BACL|nr:hypothetical protein SAMN04487970_10517 [Paenibacillus tianmuensis]